MPRQIKVTFYLAGTLHKDGDWYVSECLGLPVTSQGETDTEAISNLIEAVSLFVQSCLERGTLKDVLIKYNWRPQLKPFRNLPPKSFSFPVPLPQVVQRQLEECRA